jgi:hypothetical protein
MDTKLNDQLSDVQYYTRRVVEHVRLDLLSEAIEWCEALVAETTKLRGMLRTEAGKSGFCEPRKHQTPQE